MEPHRNSRTSNILSREKFRTSNFFASLLILFTPFVFSSNVFEFSQQVEYRQKTLDPAFKGVVLDYRMEIDLWNDRNGGNRQLTMCKEKFLAFYGVFLTRRNFYGLEKINEKMERLESTKL